MASDRIDHLFHQFLADSKKLAGIIERMKGDAVALRATAYDQAVRWKTMLKNDRDGLLALIRSEKAAAQARCPISFFLDKHFLPILAPIGEDYHKLLRGIDEGLTREDYMERGVTVLTPKQRRPEPKPAPVAVRTPARVQTIINKPLPPMPRKDAPVEHRIAVGEKIIVQQREQVQALRQETKRLETVAVQAERKVKIAERKVEEVKAKVEEIKAKAEEKVEKVVERLKTKDEEIAELKEENARLKARIRELEARLRRKEAA